jgi:DHA1 family tetracycline resistance protein-like MFS transporter
VAAMDKRRLAIAFSIVLVDMLGFSLILPLLRYIAVGFGASDFAVGLLISVYALGQFFGAPVLGRLSDRFGRRPILLVSIFGTFVGFMVLGFANTLWMLFLSRIIDGITGGNISVAQAYISDVTDQEHRGQALGLIGAAFGIGFVLGPVTGGILGEAYGYSVPAFVAAGLAALNMGLVAFLMPESLTREMRERLSARKRPIIDIAGLRQALEHPRVGPLLTIRTVTALAFQTFESGFAIWAPVAIGLTARQNGMVLGYIGVLQIIIQGALIRPLTRRYPEGRLMTVMIALAGASLVAWTLSPNVWVLLVVFIPLSIGMAVSNTLQSSLLSKSVGPEEVGTVFGLSTSALSLMRIPAGVLAGTLTGLATWSPGVFCGALALGVVPFAWRRCRGGVCEEPMGDDEPVPTEP